MMAGGIDVAAVVTEPGALLYADRQGGGYRLVQQSTRDLWRAAPAGRGLRRAIQQRIGWALEDELDDYGEAEVSGAAENTLLSLAEGLELWAPEASEVVPHVSLSANGGLIAEWRGVGKDVVLLVSPLGDARLHRVAIPEDSPVTQEVTTSPGVAALRDALCWLSG